MEEWREIDGFPNYAISSEGRVCNVTTDRILKPWVSTSGYHTIYLCNAYGKKPKQLHRLVAAAFLHEKIDGFEINHIDGVKTHNYVSNLEIVTSSGNRQHAYDTFLRESHTKRVRNVETGDVFHSMAEADRFIGANRGGVSSVIYGHQKTVRGYHFELVD